MKKFIKIGFSVLTGFVLQSTVASAHHAVQAQFDVQQVVTFSGVMTQVELINPHPYFHIDVETDEGQTENWAIESVALNALRRAGLLKELAVGREYTVEVHPARNGENVALMVAITLPDGNRLLMRSLDPTLATQ